MEGREVVIHEKTPAESATFLADILGDRYTTTAGGMLSTGAILDLMDVCAGRVAWMHVGGMVATVSFDKVELFAPVSHMDLVRVEARVVETGSSSMTVYCSCYKHDIQTRQFIKTTESFIVMVALDPETRRPNKNIPRIRLETQSDKEIALLVAERKKLNRLWMNMQKESNDGTPLKAKDVEEASTFMSTRRELLTIPETKVVIRKQSMPRNLNHSQTLFGGDILLWMEQAAVYAGKRFTQNEHMLTLTMNRLSFTQPIFVEDVIEMHARVVYVRKYILEVEVTCFVDRQKAIKLVPSHTGYFTLLNLDPLGMKRPICTGLKFSDDDQESLLTYKKAKDRFLFEQKHMMAQAQAPSELNRVLSAADEADAGQKFAFH
ncbi:Acyl-coenzyme A thioesterase 11 [Porphyridium purpureum]|uniref:Acyl-coenzyme A thioesterase 11 n=1 Tax=Porphyridium purpureum TaxID=35688 RepID=A0A5J4Z6W7_PORPP|nr:Acyl-coenzyme A thioesterase 11 [Porphyridium purpureum]|eukprot:POR8377..scf295_1